jgi:hypothetical protein
MTSCCGGTSVTVQRTPSRSVNFRFSFM